ncbi:MAG: MFS transporter [Nocardioides sp.]|uniref:MFS transporter n=1 Tax=Nocardioides sp. TaxID=35761 RepID=UPI0039E55EBE
MSSRRHRGPVLLLETGTLLSGIGNGVALVVLPWLVLDLTGSAGIAGLVSAATLLPLLVSSVFAGTLVDIVGRKRTSVASDILSGLAVAAIPLVDVVGTLTLGWFGPLNALWVTATGFALSTILTVCIRGLPGAGRPPEHAAVAGIWRGTAEGLRFVWSIVITCVLLAAVALFPPFWLMVTLSVGVGALYGPVNPIGNLAIQLLTPETLRGRVIGVITSSAYAAGPFGLLIAGPLVEWLGVQAAALVFATLGVLAALTALGMPGLRQLDRLDIPTGVHPQDDR